MSKLHPKHIGNALLVRALRVVVWALRGLGTDYQCQLRSPISQSLPPESDNRLCFLIAPFHHDFDKAYEMIKAIVKNYTGLTCIKANEIEKSGVITRDVNDYIKKARVLIADLTTFNANVFFEVGLAYAWEKKVI